MAYLELFGLNELFDFKRRQENEQKQKLIRWEIISHQAQSQVIISCQAEISARKNAPVTRQKILNFGDPKATKNCSIPGDILKKV